MLQTLNFQTTENIDYRTVLPDGNMVGPVRGIARKLDFAGYRNHPGG